MTVSGGNGLNRLSIRENYLRAVRRQSPQWVPMDFFLTPETEELVQQHIGDTPVEDYFGFDVRFISPVQPTPTWDLKHAVTPEEVDAVPWLDLAAGHLYEDMAKEVSRLHAEGYPTATGGPNFFETFWGLRGMERLLVEMAEGSPMATRLYDRLGEAEILAAEQVARTGTDVLGSSADVATQRGPMMSQRMWRTFIFPIMREAYAAAKRIKPDILIYYHCCGNVMDFIEPFMEAGVDILDPCQPEALDIFEAKRRYGDSLSFHGGIGIQSVIRDGTAADVRDTVRRTIEVMGEGGGYICSPSHTLLPETPWANLLAFVDAAREYGAYD